VRALGDRSVEIVTERPLAMLLNQLSFVMIVPSGSPERIEQPVGTGPYRVAHASASELRLTAFDGYWGGPAAEREVALLLVLDREAGVAELLAGALDLLTDVSPGDVARLRSAELPVVSWPLPAVEVLRPSHGPGPLSDLRVRRAVHLALDRDDLVERMARGHGRPASQLVTRDVFGYDPELRPAKRNVEEARRLLAAAGHPHGLDVTLEVHEARDAGIIAEQLAEAGIRATLETRQWQAMLQVGPGSPTALTQFALLSDSGDAGLLFDSTLHARDPARGFGDTNRRGYANPELDRLIEAASEEPDVLQRLPLLQRCMRLAMDDLPFIPLFERHTLYAFRKGLRWRLRHDGRVLAHELRRQR
jgi:peptide/nickel transport system substrate-binding protein